MCEKADPKPGSKEFMQEFYRRKLGEWQMLVGIEAEDLARRAHAGQTRKTGEPYFNHVFRVVEAVDDWTAHVVAYLHDVLEDCHDPAILKELDTFPEPVVAAVKLLTRAPGETYFDFVHRILASGNQTAVAVKIADLKDNLRDLEEGHQKDKYRFALELLSP